MSLNNNPLMGTVLIYFVTTAELRTGVEKNDLLISHCYIFFQVLVLFLLLFSY